MNHTVTLQGYDGSTTIIPFDNAITIASLLKRYREQTGYGGCIEFLDMDHPTEQPVEHAVVIRSNKTLFVQKSEFEAIPDKDTLQQLVNHYCDDLFTDKERERYGPIEYWNVSLLTDLSRLFMNKRKFNQPLNHWDVSHVTDMSSMFEKAYRFNQPLNSWDVRNVTNMQCMFSATETFNQPLNSWDVSNVTNIRGMFYNAEAFNQPLNNWDVSKVTDMRGMFNGAKTFEHPLNSWDISNTTNRSCMFGGALAFNRTFNQAFEYCDNGEDHDSDSDY